MSRSSIGTVCLLVCSLALQNAACANDDSPALQLFEERIMPIFRSEKPSSCVQCHLSSVDIKDYILPSHRDTFVSLREQGLVDVDSPEKSKILTLIRMGDKDIDKGARLIHEQTRRAEFEAFSSWIIACCRDPELRELTAGGNSKPVGPAKPVEVVRHARKSRVVDSFARNIWSQRMRCFPCHTPHELDENNPKHKVPIQRQAEYVDKYGEKINFFEATPEATMDRLIASSRRRIPGRYPLINLDDPANSLLILKPTSKLPPKDEEGRMARPSSKDPVSHMGGLKMHVNDQSYKSFVNWIQDYADVVGDRYSTVDELPVDNWIPSQRILRMKDIPKELGDLQVVQLFVHSRNTNGEGWSAEPVAFTQGTITPRRMVNGALFLLASESSAATANPTEFALPPGTYLIKVCVDKEQRLSEDPAMLLGSDAFVGQALIETEWKIGFRDASTFSASELQMPRQQE